MKTSCEQGRSLDVTPILQSVFIQYGLDELGLASCFANTLHKKKDALNLQHHCPVHDKLGVPAMRCTFDSLVPTSSIWTTFLAGKLFARVL